MRYCHSQIISLLCQMTFCVTGAGGFIGSAVASALLQRNDIVIGIDDLSAHTHHPNTRDHWSLLQNHPNFHPLQLDIRSSDLAQALLDMKQNLGDIDAVCHFAAKPGVRDSHLQFDEYNSINVEGTKCVLAAATSAGINRVLFASSSCVYGTGSLPFVEVPPAALPKAVSHYGWTKIQGELVTEDWSRSIPEAQAIVFRLFSVYGEHMRPDLAISIFRDHLKRGKTVPVFGQGHDSRDYTYIDDVVDAVLLGLDQFQHLNSPTSFFNVGYGQSTSTLELLQMVADQMGQSPEVRHMPGKKEEMSATLASTSKSARELNFIAKHSLEEGLNLMFAT